MTIFLALEALSLVVLFGYTLVGFAGRGDDDLLASVSILIVAAVAAFWAGATFLGLTKRQRWARSSALTIQILIFSVAVGAFQGIYAQPAVGWALVVPAAITFVAALMARPEGTPNANASTDESADSSL